MEYKKYPRQDFKIHGYYDKVRSRSHHDVAHLQPVTNVPTKYQRPTPYSFQDIAKTGFYMSRSLQRGQRTDQGHIMTLHTYNP